MLATFFVASILAQGYAYTYGCYGGSCAVQPAPVVAVSVNGPVPVRVNSFGRRVVYREPATRIYRPVDRALVLRPRGRTRIYVCGPGGCP